jgi:hypothetical protein
MKDLDESSPMIIKTHDNGGNSDECLGCGMPWTIEASYMPCPRPCQASGWPTPLTDEELDRLRQRRSEFLVANAKWPVGETGALAEARGRALAAYQVELECCAWPLIGAAEELAVVKTRAERTERELIRCKAALADNEPAATIDRLVEQLEQKEGRADPAEQALKDMTMQRDVMCEKLNEYIDKTKEAENERDELQAKLRDMRGSGLG